VSEYLRRCWAASKVYRVALVIAVVYVVLRLAVHGAYLAMMLYPDAGIMGGVPEWAGAENEPMVPDDLRIYLDAATRLHLKQDLYLSGTVDRMEFYQYPPFYALTFVPFLWLPRAVVAIVYTILHIVIYGLLYIRWGYIFRQLDLDKASEMLAWTLPVWLVFAAFWGDLGYLNVYIFTALLSTWLIDAVLNESLGRSFLWLSIILQIKPQWAFAIALPLFFGRYRFFVKLLALTIVIYVAIAGTTMLIVGPDYGWSQYVDYFQLLRNIQSGDYPWRGPEMPFLGYNHSIKQTVVYLLGVAPSVLHLTTGIKVLLLLPLVGVFIRYIFQPIGRPGYTLPTLALDFVFALYLGAFIWLDVVWELSLGIAVFTYLLATSERRWCQVLVWCVFLPYALLDVIQVASFAVLGMDVIVPGPYVLTDPSIYVPLVMIVILTFYGLLLKRLWDARPMRRVMKVSA